MAKSRAKVCMSASAILFIIVSIVTIALIFTVFKPKDPNITVRVASVNLITPDMPINMSLPTLVTIGNPNYGSFNFQNSFSYITYRDTIVGIVPIESKLVPARSEINMTTHANFMVDKLIHNPKFWTEVVPGMKFTMTSNAVLPGKVIVLKFIKLKGTAYNACNISVNMTSNYVESICKSKIKLF